MGKLTLHCSLIAGASIPPRDHDAFPSVSDSPCFRKVLRFFWKINKILPFPEKISDFHPPKFLMTFLLVIDHKFWISPYFGCFRYISPLIGENYYFLSYFHKFPPLFSENSPAFYILSVYFFTPTLTMMQIKALLVWLGGMTNYHNCHRRKSELHKHNAA